MSISSTFLFTLITDKTDRIRASCSLCGKIQYCKVSSTSAIFINGITNLYIMAILYEKHNYVKI